MRLFIFVNSKMSTPRRNPPRNAGNKYSTAYIEKTKKKTTKKKVSQAKQRKDLGLSYIRKGKQLTVNDYPEDLMNEIEAEDPVKAAKIRQKIHMARQVIKYHKGPTPLTRDQVNKKVNEKYKEHLKNIRKQSLLTAKQREEDMLNVRQANEWAEKKKLAERRKRIKRMQLYSSINDRILQAKKIGTGQELIEPLRAWAKGDKSAFLKLKREVYGPTKKQIRRQVLAERRSKLKTLEQKEEELKAMREELRSMKEANENIPIQAVKSTKRRLLPAKRIGTTKKERALIANFKKLYAQKQQQASQPIEFPPDIPEVDEVFEERNEAPVLDLPPPLPSPISSAMSSADISLHPSPIVSSASPSAFASDVEDAVIAAINYRDPKLLARVYRQENPNRQVYWSTNNEGFYSKYKRKAYQVQSKGYSRTLKNIPFPKTLKNDEDWKPFAKDILKKINKHRGKNNKAKLYYV